MNGDNAPVPKRVLLHTITSKIGSGSTPRGGSRSYKSVGIPLIRSMNVHFDGFRHEGLVHLDDTQAGSLDGVIVKAGDVLLNITGASIGRVTQAPPEMEGARVNQHVCIIRPTDCLDPCFLARYLASPAMQTYIAHGNYGVTRQALTKGMIEKLSIPLPTLAEQRAAVAEQDEVLLHSNVARDELDRIPKLVERYKQAVLAAAFRGHLTSEWRIRCGIVKDASWSNESLAGLLSDVRYGTAKKCDYEPLATPVLRIPNVAAGRIDTTDLKFGSFDENEIRKLSLDPGDLLVIRSNGSPDLVGRVALATEDVKGFLFAGYLIRLRPDRQRVLPEFLSYAFEEPSTRISVQRFAKSTSGVNNINSEQLRSLVIPLPSLPEQEEIVSQIRKTNAVIAGVAAEAARAAALIGRLEKANLSKAFESD